MIFNSMPLWLSGIVLVIVPTALAMAGTSFVRSRIGLERLRTNNEVAGFKFATVGVLYAVLLAFAVIVAWQNFSNAEDHVALEAGSAATLYRLAEGMEAEPRDAVRKQLTAYLESTITDEWPAMEDGNASATTTRALDDLYTAVLTSKPADFRGAMLLQEMLRQINTLTEARRARIVKAAGSVPGLLWAVLFVGAVVTVGFTFFFGTDNLPAQSVMTGALAFLIFSGLLVIVTIDKPFAGTVRIHPEAIVRVLEQVGHTPLPGTS
jgi:hypothetical protein